MTLICPVFFQAACETFGIRGKDHIHIPKLYTSSVAWEPHHYRLVQGSQPLDLRKGTCPSAPRSTC